MIVAMALMSTGTALSGPVLPKSFRVETQNAFEKRIYVTERTTAGTGAMKISPNARLRHPLVLAVNSGAKTVSALLMKGSVISKSIATMGVTNPHIVMSMNAPKVK